MEFIMNTNDAFGTNPSNANTHTLTIQTLRGTRLEIPYDALLRENLPEGFQFPDNDPIDHEKTDHSELNGDGVTHLKDADQVRWDLPVSPPEFIQAIFDRPEIILENPYYYLYRSNYFRSDLIYVGSTNYVALGPLLESCLHTGSLAVQVPDKRYLNEDQEHPMGTFYLLNAGGSPLSGMHSAMTYDPRERVLLGFSSWRGIFQLPGSLYKWTLKFKTLNDQFPWKLRNQPAIEYRMLSDLGLN